MHWIGRTVILLALLVIGLAVALPRISTSSDSADVADARSTNEPLSADAVPSPALHSNPPPTDDNLPLSPLKNDLTRSLDGMIQSHGEIFQDSEFGLRDRLEEADQRLSSIKSEIRGALRNANRQIRPAGQRSPNVVLVLLEGVRKGDLGFYGNPGRTPLLEGLAERAAVFNTCYAGPTPEVARHMLLTGQGHNHSDARDNRLAEMMWKSGYRTILLEDSMWLQPAERQAFDQQISLRTAPDSTHPTELVVNGAAAKVVANQNDDPADDLNGSQLLFEQARHLTRPGASSARPQFLQLQVTLEASAPEARRKLVDQWDVALGRWIHSLEEEGGRPVLLVLAGLPVADQSSAGPSAVANLKEEHLQVPLMIYHSGLSELRRMDSPCALIDLLPTLAEAIQSARVPRSDGTSLLSWIQGDDRTPPAERVFRWRDPQNSERFAVRQGPWKAIFGSSGQLYYLPNDPHEQRNVAGEHPDVLQTLAKFGQAEL